MEYPSGRCDSCEALADKLDCEHALLLDALRALESMSHLGQDAESIAYPMKVRFRMAIIGADAVLSRAREMGMEVKP